MAWCAPSAVRASMTSESNIKNATTPAVRKSPWLMAASTASATSSSMCISPVHQILEGRPEDRGGQDQGAHGRTQVEHQRIVGVEQRRAARR